MYNKYIINFQRNVDRLKEYKSKVILFPKSKKKSLKGEATAEEVKMAQQFTGTILPIVKVQPIQEDDMLVDEKIRNMNIFSIERQVRTVFLIVYM